MRSLRTRTPVIAGNWKMNLDRGAAVRLVRELRESLAPGPAAAIEVGVAPPFPYLEAVHEALRGSNLFVAGQNLHAEPYGAFTGEVSGAMLKELGCARVIVGHSERRHLFGESNDTVGLKVKSALSQSLAPIVCVGETLAERKAGRTRPIVLEQIDSALRRLSEAEAISIVVAYEPVWAIGTSVNATPEQAGEVHALIRDWFSTRFSPAFAREVRIMYGGSVKPENAAELLAVDGIDGALVGGASLTASSFLKIIAACPTQAR